MRSRQPCYVRLFRHFSGYGFVFLACSLAGVAGASASPQSVNPFKPDTEQVDLVERMSPILDDLIQRHLQLNIDQMRGRLEASLRGQVVDTLRQDAETQRLLREQEEERRRIEEQMAAAGHATPGEASEAERARQEMVASLGPKEGDRVVGCMNGSIVIRRAETEGQAARTDHVPPFVLEGTMYADDPRYACN